jgi:hypothetical protein
MFHPIEKIIKTATHEYNKRTVKPKCECGDSLSYRENVTGNICFKCKFEQLERKKGSEK